MSKHLLALAAAALAAIAAPASALPVPAPATGDLAFTSFNADEDGWSMVAFTNIAAGTQIYFSDNEYVSGAFNTGESYFKWTTGAIAAGQVIRFSAIDSVTRAASNGTFAQATVSGSSNTGLSTTADTIYAYVGTSATAPVTFLAAITNAATWNNADGNLTGTGLTAGTSNAIRLSAKPGASSDADFGQYTGSRGTFASAADAKAAVGNLANWTIDTIANSSSAAIVPNTTAFTISAVPEPETYALMLAGLAAVGFLARRRA